VVTVVWPGNNPLLISSQLGFAVIVIKQEALPYFLAIAKEFWRFSLISLVLPVKVAGIIVLWSTFLGSMTF
jgi:hypothetical protein